MYQDINPRITSIISNYCIIVTHFKMTIYLVFVPTIAQKIYDRYVRKKKSVKLNSRKLNSYVMFIFHCLGSRHRIPLQVGLSIIWKECWCSISKSLTSLISLPLEPYTLSPIFTQCKSLGE